MAANTTGYFRFPTIYKDSIVFVSEDDLWQVSTEGGRAVRLTSNLGEVSHPQYSPDGRWIAFTGRDEGVSEVYVMPAEGGPSERLTYLGSMTVTVGWKGKKIIFATNYAQPFMGSFWLHTVDPASRETEKLPFGPAISITYGTKGVAIGRYTGDLAKWKRYRGGRTGKIWVDVEGNGDFHKLYAHDGNIACPMWIGDRIYFISDSNGFGNIHSCLPEGEDLKQHTHHRKFFARYASTDGKTIVYQNGADIYRFSLVNAGSEKIEIHYASPRVQLNLKYVPANKYIENYSLNSDGGSLAVTARGKVFNLGNWEGPANQLGARKEVRYRLAEYMPDGGSVVVASDEGGEDHLEILSISHNGETRKLEGLDIGRPLELKVSPKGDRLALTNHRNELILVDLEKPSMKLIDKSDHGFIIGFNWSHDGAWLAYAKFINHRQGVVFIYNPEKNKTAEVTEPVLVDLAPVFDPEGRYLFFLSARIFDPVYDNMHFDYNFPRGMRPYLVTLRKDVPSPFVPEIKGFGGTPENKKNQDEEQKSDEKDEKKEEKPLEIDFNGIKERVVAFPVAEGIYGDIAAVEGRIFYTLLPIQGTLQRNWAEKTPPANATLKVYDLKNLEEGTFVDGITSFRTSPNGAALAYRKGDKLRVVDAKRDPKQELPQDDKTTRKSGWIDFSRIKLAIDPRSEWRQMYAEAWRLQRDYFWVENMSHIRWQDVYDRYFPLLDQVGSRSEFSDLLWEMQGELGTSHAYELGGDYRQSPNYKIGFLGAALKYSRKYDAFRFEQIAAGDAWAKVAPPLKRPGVNIRKGMLLLSVGGQRVNLENPPYRNLINLAEQEVQLEVAEKDASSLRTVTVKVVGNETEFWYRDWVETNRRYVHEKSNGKAGYIHIPNMGPIGYAEFHRYFLAELNYEGLVIDVRMNGGGHVSPLLLEKLARRRIGYYNTRWIGTEAKPPESPKGPMVALTNEMAGSDGDIFSHGFKVLKLGKLIGTRTWGGVVGIWPRNWLVDGTITTQPEFSNWFFDVGYGIENYGTDPDIEIDLAPQDYMRGADPQLDTAIAEVLKEIEDNPALKPDFEKGKPDLSLPK